MAIQGFGEIAEHLRRVTVVIQSGGHGGGSGVIWSNDGLIVTNAHVVHGPKAQVQLWDGREFEAGVGMRDRARDLATLRLDAGSGMSASGAGLPTASIADSSELRAGDAVIAIGNPLGFVGGLTTGAIRGVGPVRGLGAQSWVQAAVRLAPGNSGGPLADARGAIIGINTMVAGRMALAVPSNEVRDFISAGPVQSWLGVSVHPVNIPQARAAEHTFGLVVLEVETGSPAAAASLLPGDILLGTAETTFASPANLASALRGSRPGTLRLEFLRGDYEHVRRVTVQLGNVFESSSAVAA